MLATVEQEVITSFDVQNRLLILSAFGNKKFDIKNVQSSYRLQILNELIQDALIAQKAKSDGVKITSMQIDEQIQSVAKSNNLDVQEFLKNVKSQGISEALLRQFFSSMLLKSYMIQKDIRDHIIIKEEEVENALKSTTFISYDKPCLNDYVLLAEITVYENGYSKNNVLFNKQILDALKGNSFEDVARKFSKSLSRERGGIIGWVQIKQLKKELADALCNMNIGSITNFIKNEKSNSIFKIVDRK
ncbi:MAG: peptidylprolyl isomerase, partial [Proteobacteria bacterium]|nr:peptidylprolyl isomerase [Pseudomonadota bacterium]